MAVDIKRVEAFAEGAGQACARVKRLASFASEDVESVEVSLVSDRRSAALHRQFLRVRGATDVITFAHGEIVISAAAALRGAREHGEVLEREICRYVIHGLLHLRGYEDATPADRSAMWRVQESILRELWPKIVSEGVDHARKSPRSTKMRKRLRRH